MKYGAFLNVNLPAISPSAVEFCSAASCCTCQLAAPRRRAARPAASRGSSSLRDPPPMRPSWALDAPRTCTRRQWCHCRGPSNTPAAWPDVPLPKPCQVAEEATSAEADRLARRTSHRSSHRSSAGEPLPAGDHSRSYASLPHGAGCHWAVGCQGAALRTIAHSCEAACVGLCIRCSAVLGFDARA